MLKRLTLIFSIIMIASMLLAACAPATPAAPATVAPPAPTTPPQIVEVTKIVAGTPVVQVITATPAPTKLPPTPVVIKPITIWTKFNDTKPQNTQDQWLADTIQSLKAFEKIELKNVFVPYNEINTKLNLAVQAGGDVPDVSYADMPIDFFYQNKVFVDITDFVKSAPWYSEISPSALKACTGPDGKIYCVPSIQVGSMIYYWTSAYPNGAPKTTDDLLVAAAELKKQNKFALTFNGPYGIFFWQIIRSFGGIDTDAKGNTAWATPETVKAIEFFRKLFANKYAPEVALAAGFECETPIKDGSAGLFVAGSYSYVYLNPLKSFDGKSTFDKKAGSVEAALQAGAMKIADPISAPGGKPVSSVGVAAWAIPTGSKNVEGAKAFMNYMMTARNNADFAVAFGAQPTNLVGLKDPRFNSAYWTAVADSINRTGFVPPVNKNQKAATKMVETITTLIQKPDMDIMATLKSVQDELNK